MKITRGWNPEDGSKPYSQEWWEQYDARYWLRRAVERIRRLRGK